MGEIDRRRNSSMLRNWKTRGIGSGNFLLRRRQPIRSRLQIEIKSAKANGKSPDLSEENRNQEKQVRQADGRSDHEKSVRIFYFFHFLMQIAEEVEK